MGKIMNLGKNIFNVMEVWLKFQMSPASQFGQRNRFKITFVQYLSLDQVRILTEDQISSLILTRAEGATRKANYTNIWRYLINKIVNKESRKK